MGKERKRMIFEERKDGMVIRIPHEEMMKDDVLGFIFTIMKGRGIYRDTHADLDDDYTEEE